MCSKDLRVVPWSEMNHPGTASQAQEVSIQSYLKGSQVDEFTGLGLLFIQKMADIKVQTRTYWEI